MEDKSRGEKIEAVTTQMDILSSQGIRCATDGSMALCHRLLTLPIFQLVLINELIDGGWMLGVGQVNITNELLQSTKRR
jgi:hypothetical protein